MATAAATATTPKVRVHLGRCRLRVGLIPNFASVFGRKLYEVHSGPDKRTRSTSAPGGGIRLRQINGSR